MINNFTDQVVKNITKAYNNQTKLGWKHLKVRSVGYEWDKAIQQCTIIINPNKPIQGLVKNMITDTFDL